jgi:lipopolysaccharide export system ATP-binding protein
MALLEVRGLIKNYGRRRVVNGIDFDVEAGEVVGLLGPNGAGKTTTFRMTTGQISPDMGHVWFDRVDVSRFPMYRRARLGMGYLPQEKSVFRKLTVEQNILAILEILPSARSLGRKLTRAERWERTDQVLDHFGLNHVRKNIAARLSGGETRRLEIARCLVCEPLLILLDEPFTGIDPKTITDIQQIVLQLRNSGIGVLLTDHNVREALKITDRSYLIKDGNVRTHGTPRQIIHDPIAIQEYLGTGFHQSLPGESAFPPPENGPVLEPILNVSFQEKKSVPEIVAAASVDDDQIQRWIEGLKTPDREKAGQELAKLGEQAVPFLLKALERRDVELRRQAHAVLQNINRTPISFDPFAPEAMRRQQIRTIRERWERKAG